ncbi:MAG: CBS domain-containing protein [Candidatus Micrarchaeia archaeon]
MPEDLQIKIPYELIDKTLSFDYNDPISKVIPYLAKYHALVVNKDNDYYGVVSIRNLTRSEFHRIPKNQAVGVFASRLPKITEYTSLMDAIFYFYKTKARALPYIQNGKIKGVLSRFSLLKMMLSLKLLQGIPIKDAMTSPIYAVDINSSVAQSLNIMRSMKINRLLVLDNNKFAGIVTNHDIMRNYMQVEDRPPQIRSIKYSKANIPIKDVINPNAVSISQNNTLADAARLMIERSISSLVVMDNKTPVGILTILDILESSISKLHSNVNNIFITGLDSSTYIYEDEIREEARQFMEKAAKFSKVGIKYITLNIKKQKTKRYEISARLATEKRGIIVVHASDFLLEKTLSKALDSLLAMLKKDREKTMSIVKAQYRED